ncbi:MAG: hypothetical protein A2Y16_01585 [Tenericutes bacterium GWF2_57_13]|nr:MAG: hypothetical protein A2Y16_01585 [Tenericutes bacterium GWF2_57_13]
MPNYLTHERLLNELKSSSDDANQVVSMSEMVTDIIMRLIDERVNQGLSQQKLAEMCGMKQSGIARIERLQVMPRIDTLAKMAFRLNLVIRLDDGQERTKLVVVYDNQPSSMLGVSNFRVEGPCGPTLEEGEGSACLA